MRQITAALFCLLTLLAASGGAWSAADPLANMHGKTAVVLLFIASDCPISNSYAPEIQRICARYTPKNIAFTLVYSDPDLTLSAAKKHAHDYGYTSAILLDPSHRLSRRAGATVTPEAAVYAHTGKLLYRGRIDDLYASLGQRRYVVTKHDLRDALNAILRGQPVPTPTTTAIGCFL